MPSIRDTRFSVGASFAAAGDFAGVAGDAIIILSAGVARFPADFARAGPVKPNRRFNSLTCSLNNCNSWLLSLLRHSTTLAETPVPETIASLTSSRPCPPTRIWNVVPC